MKFWNLTATNGDDGAKALDVTLFGDIDMGFFGDGVASAEIAAQLAEHADAKAITVHVNSRGGDAFGGVAIYNALKNHAAPVTVHVEGLAASAASVVAMAGDRVVMERGSMMMVHNPYTYTAGGADDLRATADVLDKLRDSLVAVYKAKTGKTPAALRALLAAETWFTAEEAKAQGFADEIAAAPVKVKAEGEQVFLGSVAFARANVPAQILAMASEPPPAVEPVPAPRAITRDVLAAEAPVVLAALLAEGKASAAADVEAARIEGAAAERARIKALDELVPDAAPAARAVIRAAQFDAPRPVEAVAVDLLRAGAAKPNAAPDVLAARARDSASAASVGAHTPVINERAEAESAIARDIANRANARGGAR